MKIILLIIGLVTCISIHSVYATTVLPMSLQDLTKKASYIFHARAVSNRVEFDNLSQRVVTITRFNILQPIKGTTSDTYEIKQLGGHLPGSKFYYVAHGIPQFVVDEEYVVFLPEKSRLGFSSPVGLGQGSVMLSQINERTNFIKKIRHLKGDQ